MQCVADSASTIGLWASSTWSRSTPALLHCGLPSCLPPLINIFGQVCPSDCHWSYRPRPRPVNWHWTDSGGETRRQLTSLTDFWHNFFRCQCPAHASNMFGENTIVLQFKSSKTGCIWNWAIISSVMDTSAPCFCLYSTNCEQLAEEMPFTKSIFEQFWRSYCKKNDFRRFPLFEIFAH